MTTVCELIERIRDRLLAVGVESPRPDAELIVAHCLSVERHSLSLYNKKAVTLDEESRAERLMLRRENREPIHYILGHREFWSIDLDVKQGVLIPRPETESLVQAALDHLRSASLPISSERTNEPIIWDICTGSGAIAIAIATETRGRFRILAADISIEALIVASANVRRHGLSDVITLVASDMGEAFSASALDGEVQLIVSNPPYIISGEFDGLQAEVSKFEPRIALDGGPEGLDYYPRLMRIASKSLADGGALIVEIAPQMPAEIERISHEFRQFLMPPRFVNDLSGRPRVAALAKRWS
ncbi:peptide chain release factor N(5)-glutamine methyltransferase [bacterium]|nr:peptide chain release factor N(5)-glutamine methyltransferase [bacterium]